MKHILPLLALAACAPAAAPIPAPTNVTVDVGQIETDTSGRCFANDVAPAVIETVTTQEIDTAEVRNADGTIASPASFRTVTRQQIIRERSDIRFETLCPQNYSAELVSTLQRALKARAIYAGPITGILDQPTGAAIQRFQREDGIDSPLLSLQAARKLGIVAAQRTSGS